MTDKKARGFPFTDYELDLGFLEKLTENKSVEYLIAGEEICPKTGRTHWQSFIYFKNPRSWKSVEKLLKPRNFRIMSKKATAKDNEKYCKKDKKIIIEYGECPSQGKRVDLEEIREELAEGKKTEAEIAEMDFQKWCMYRKAFSEYRMLKEPKRDWVTEVIYLWGDSGSGKTRRAVEDGAKILQYKEPFVMGYDGEDVVCFDDVDENTFDRHFLIQATDRYAIDCMIKGGKRNWKPRKIYFTSNFPPWQIYPFNIKEMDRRYTEITHMTLKKNGTEDMEQK